MSLLICCMHGVFELFISVIKWGVDWELRQKYTLLYLNNLWTQSTPFNSTFSQKIFLLKLEYFSRQLFYWETNSCCAWAFGNIFDKFRMKKHPFTFSYIQTGDYCNYCSSLGGQQCLQLWKTCTCWWKCQLSKISTGRVNYVWILWYLLHSMNILLQTM